jgi:hypothetical protein
LLAGDEDDECEPDFALLPLDFPFWLAAAGETSRPTIVSNSRRRRVSKTTDERPRRCAANAATTLRMANGTTKVKSVGPVSIISFQPNPLGGLMTGRGHVIDNCGQLR